MATAQKPIISLLCIYHFVTAHLPIIYLVQINQLFHHFKSSKYLITVQKQIQWQLQIAYFEKLRQFIWLLRKAQFFGYSVLYNYFATAHLPIICLLKIDQLFHHWKSSNYLVTLHRKIVSQIQIDYLEKFRRFIWLLRKAEGMTTAHYTIIFLVRILQFSVYCKSANYFTTGNCLNIWLLCIEKLYDNFKSPVWKHFDDLYG